MLALYRKYRPKTLSEVIGQDQVVKPLESALVSGKVSHSYLFTGPRGCGKTSVARILAHEINGFKYELEDSYLDIIEIDAASNTGVDNIRDLREKAIIAPSEGKYKVYIIDEVHMLSKSAFNALLKTLEEPPAHTVFILATTDLEKVPVTITSRSQVFTFRLADPEVMFSHLDKICQKEKIAISPSALRLIVRKSGGSFRDSLSILDQIASLSNNGSEITEEMVANCLGLPLDSVMNSLFDAYISNNRETIAKILKDLIDSGLKPESIASSALTTIIQNPKEELLPLLAELPKVTAPYSEAKLLLAFLKPAENPNNFTPKKQPQVFLASSQTIVETSIIKEEPEQRITTIEKPILNPKHEDYPKIVEQSNQNIAPKSPLPPMIAKRLEKCRIEETDQEINIYPSTEISKRFLERPQNLSALKSNFNKDILIHDPSEFKNKPEFTQISDIMGKVQEVKDINGGIPF